MCSILTEDELEEFRKILFSSDENGQRPFNIRNLEVAMKTFNLSVTDRDLKTIEDDLEKENIDGETLMTKVLRMAEEKEKSRQDLEEIKNAAIFSLSSLIDILGQALTEEAIDETIANDEEGDADVKRILAVLDREERAGDRAMEGHYSFPGINIDTFRRRVICLGVITKSLGKNMTEDDLMDMLSDDNSHSNEKIITNYSKLLTLIENKMRAIGGIERIHKQENLLEVHQIKLSEVRNVMSKLGSVMISVGQTCADSDVESIINWNSEYFEVPRPIATLIENAFGCEYDFDIFQEFHELDSQKSGYIKAEDLRKMLTKSDDPLTDNEVDQIFKEAGVNEKGEFNYHDFIKNLRSADIQTMES